MVSAFASFKFGVAFCFTQLISVLLVFYVSKMLQILSKYSLSISSRSAPSRATISTWSSTSAWPPSPLSSSATLRHTHPSPNRSRPATSSPSCPCSPSSRSSSYRPWPTSSSGSTCSHSHGISVVQTWIDLRSWILYCILYCVRYVKYQFEKNLWPPKSSYEQTNVFLYACAAAVIAAIIYSKGAPYRKPLYTNGERHFVTNVTISMSPFSGIMATWTVAGVATVIFMALYKSEDFSTRLNFKIAPNFQFQCIVVIGMIVNFVFCYIWEVRLGLHLF